MRCFAHHVGSVGVEPSVNFNATRMRLGAHEGQRVIEGVRRGTLRAGQVLTPRLDVAGVESVTHRPHCQVKQMLQNYRH